KSQIDKHIQLKADIVLAGPLATSRRKLDGFGLYSVADRRSSFIDDGCGSEMISPNVEIAPVCRIGARVGRQVIEVAFPWLRLQKFLMCSSRPIRFVAGNSRQIARRCDRAIALDPNSPPSSHVP